MTLAKNRPFTQMAAAMLGEKELASLNDQRCPLCDTNDFYFRDAISEREHKISGLCQNCQDETFGDEA